MLLGIASELPDHEPLLQKHFSALLSAAWRDISRSSHRKHALSSRNGFYSFQKLFSTTFNHQNTMVKLPQRLEFTNLHQCGNLVAAALSGDTARKIDARSSVFNQREEILVTKERLDVTLELQAERDEASTLPSIINLSILGPDPSPALKIYSGEERHLRPARSQVQSQFRYNLLFRFFRIL